jgi:hypothetical protein
MGIRGCVGSMGICEFDTSMNPSSPTFKDLLDFIMSNKADKVFKGYTIHQIAFMVKEAIAEDCLYYALNDSGCITGMILAKQSIPSKTVWVEENLAMTLDNLRAFAIQAKRQFSGFTFAGFKRGKCKSYDQFINRMSLTSKGQTL